MNKFTEACEKWHSNPEKGDFARVIQAALELYPDYLSAVADECNVTEATVLRWTCNTDRPSAEMRLYVVNFLRDCIRDCSTENLPNVERCVKGLADALGVTRFHYTWSKMLEMVKERSEALRKIKDASGVLALGER